MQNQITESDVNQLNNEGENFVENSMKSVLEYHVPVKLNPLYMGPKDRRYIEI